MAWMLNPGPRSWRWAAGLAVTLFATAGLGGEAGSSLDGRGGGERQDTRPEVTRELLSELESIRAGRADHFDSRRADAGYAAAFRRAGLDIDVVTPKQAGDWIVGQGSPVEMALFLDDWAEARASAGRDQASRRRLAEAASAADPDSWRVAVRNAMGIEGAPGLTLLRGLADDGAAIAAQPAESLRLLGRRLRAGGDSDRAAVVLRRAWGKRPDDFWVNFDLALARGRARGTSMTVYSRPEEAVRYLKAAVAIRPRSAMAHRCLGDAYRALEKLEQATAEYREAIRLSPDDADAHHGLAAALQEQDRMVEAAAEWREVLRLRPERALAHANLGTVLRSQRKLAEAAAECREAIRLEPGLAPAHFVLGNVLFDLKKGPEAIAEYREAIRLRPRDSSFHVGLAIALDAQGALAEATTELREAVRLDPRNPAAHYNLGVALGEADKTAESMAEYRRAIRLEPKHDEAHNNLGAALRKLGEYDQAIAELREAVRLRPDQIWYRNNLAYAQREAGDLAGSLETVHEALRRHPEHGELLAIQAETLILAGRFAEAVAVLERATKAPGLEPENADFYRELIARVRKLAGADDMPAGPGGSSAIERADRAAADDRPALAARIYEVVMDLSEARAEDLTAGHRARAARAAARAGCGQGKDDPRPGPSDRAELRKLALGWLRDELKAREKAIRGGDPTARSGSIAALRMWKDEPDLSGVRDPGALGSLPEPERAEWRAFWADVDRVVR